MDDADHHVLETPINRIQIANRMNHQGITNDWDDDQEFNNFIKKQKNEYSDEQVKEMQMSIRNVSTNKKPKYVSNNYLASKKSARRKNEEFIGIGRQLAIQGLSRKLEQKEIESFRAGPITVRPEEFDASGKIDRFNFVIKEEHGLSDDEQNNYMTESQETNRHKHNRSEIQSIKHDHRFSRNPNYSRITHASKQQLTADQPPAPQRMGQTMMGFHYKQTIASPLMQSLPNLSILKIQERSREDSNYFEITQGAFQTVQNWKEFNHLSSYNEQINNSFFQPLTQQLSQNNDHILKERKIGGYHSPQLSIANNLKVLQQRSYKEITETPPKDPTSIKIFEEFFIIGASNNDLTQLDWTQSQRHFISPKTLYMHNQDLDEQCERRRVVKDFCFPDGIEVTQIKGRGISSKQFQLSSRVNKILYSSKSLKEQCFIFTMNANEESPPNNDTPDSEELLETFPEGGQQDKYYNCLCVVFNELIPSGDLKFSSCSPKDLPNQFESTCIYQTKKAFCFMFSNSYYQVHLDVISMLLNALKLERLELSQQLLSQTNKIVHLEQSITDLMAFLDLQIINLEMKTILQKFYSIQLNEQSMLPLDESNQLLQIDLGREFGVISYQIPSSLECKFLDCLWYCPTLFSLFSLDTLLSLLTSVLLERSIVFIGKQSVLSGAILGLNSLLYPFKWCLALVPILPHPLIEMLEAPLPLLVGITKREYKDVTLTPLERESKIWVFLETGEIIWNKDGQIIPKFDFKQNEELELEYSNFKSVHQQITHTAALTSRTNKDKFGLESDRSSKASDLDISQIHTDDIKSSCLKIVRIIRGQIKTHILSNIKKKQRTLLDVEQNDITFAIGNLVVENGRKQDLDFLKQFVRSQMFTIYIEEHQALVNNFNNK